MIQKTFLKLFIVSCLAILLISCDSGTEPNDDKPIPPDTLYSQQHFLWPMKVGNTWDYVNYQIRRELYDTVFTYNGFQSFDVSPKKWT
ncbi:MAG: hypothetical protein JEY94_19260 [Melioribacteraceae bacterium]|nr:hypothetical protein [Melioribacteraceae bacterium]